MQTVENSPVADQKPQTSPRRYGEATPDQAKELHEEGVEFHPLPVLPDEWN